MSYEPGTNQYSRFFYGSVTRNTDLRTKQFKIESVHRRHWSTGDFVVGRAKGVRNRLYRCETEHGRLANLIPGDLLVGALGVRAATLEATGDWHDVGEDLEIHALTPAGLFGKTTSISPFLPDLVTMDYCGHVVRDAKQLNMIDFVRPVLAQSFDLPVILLIGTSMSAGKTTSAQVIIRTLNHLGYKVAAAKLTGAARYRDILSFGDAGAEDIFDFVDAGLPSTVCPEDRFRTALGVLLDKVSATQADVLVAEAGASPLEPYNGACAQEMLGPNTCFVLLCASDPYAVLGVRTAFGSDFNVDLVTGPAANTLAGVNLVKKLCDLPALNLLDQSSHPMLEDMLKKALHNAG